MRKLILLILVLSSGLNADFSKEAESEVRVVDYSMDFDCSEESEITGRDECAKPLKEIENGK